MPPELHAHPCLTRPGLLMQPRPCCVLQMNRLTRSTACAGEMAGRAWADRSVGVWARAATGPYVGTRSVLALSH